MPRLLGSLLVLVVAASAACSGGDDATDPTATSAPTRPEITPLATAPGATPFPERTSAEAMEVQGVVGAVDARAGTIEIRATGGSSITTIELAPGAEITRPDGTSIQLADVRPSDRIVASGVASADPETLLADAVTAQQVVPGGPPGANPGG